MFKFIFALASLGFIAISQNVYSIQYFENNKQLKEIKELSQEIEQREQARQQINIQKEMLNLQKRPYYYGR